MYWPEEKGKTVHHGSVHLTLQSKKEKPFWTERILHLTHSEVCHSLYKIRSVPVGSRFYCVENSPLADIKAPSMKKVEFKTSMDQEEAAIILPHLELVVGIG